MAWSGTDTIVQWKLNLVNQQIVNFFNIVKFFWWPFTKILIKAFKIVVFFAIQSHNQLLSSKKLTESGLYCSNLQLEKYTKSMIFTTDYKFNELIFEKAKNSYDPNVIRTRSLLIWSQTRYHCATESRWNPVWKIGNVCISCHAVLYNMGPFITT